MNFEEDEYKSPTSFLDIFLNSIQTINPSINNESPKINLFVKIDINKIINWYHNIRKIDKSVVKNVHLDKLNKWNYNKKKAS